MAPGFQYPSFMRELLSLILLLCMLVSPVWSSPESADPPTDNPELQRMFAEDQAARQADRSEIDWKKVTLEDAARRERVKRLLDEGAVRTGLDYWHAAFIFQHGSKPDDFLLAHVLACASMSKGYEPARWIAAASLDRYLGNIGQPQIYGTQYLMDTAGQWGQGSYNSELISDQLRAIFGVPTRAEQEAKVQELRQRN